MWQLQILFKGEDSIAKPRVFSATFIYSLCIPNHKDLYVNADFFFSPRMYCSSIDIQFILFFVFVMVLLLSGGIPSPKPLFACAFANVAAFAFANHVQNWWGFLNVDS